MNENYFLFILESSRSPFDVVTEIVSFLTVPERLQFSLVNRQSRKYLMDSKMWEFVDLKGVIVISDTVFAALHRFSDKVRSFYIDSRHFLEPPTDKVEFLVSNFANLELLDISKTNAVCNVDFLEDLPKLEHLIMNNVSVELQLSCTRNLEKCHALATFSFKGNLVVGGRAMASMLSKVPTLCWVDIEGSGELFPSQARQVCIHCPNLHTLLFNIFCQGTVDHRDWIKFHYVDYPSLGLSFYVTAQIARLNRMYKWLDR